MLAVLERIDDAGAQRNQPDAAGHEDQVLAVVILHRKAVAVRAAHGELVARLELMQGGGATADLADGEEGLLLGGAGRQRGGKLAHAEQGHLRELARAEALESALLRRVLEVPVKRLDLRRSPSPPGRGRPASADKCFRQWRCPVQRAVAECSCWSMPASSCPFRRLARWRGGSSPPRWACRCRRGKRRRSARSPRRPWTVRAG